MNLLLLFFYFILSAYHLVYILVMCYYSIMEGEQGLQRFSPEVIIQDKSIRDAVSHLPPITLFHGTSDYSIPSDARLGGSLELLLQAHYVW